MPKTASLSLFPWTCAIPQSSRTIVVFKASTRQRRSASCETDVGCTKTQAWMESTDTASAQRRTIAFIECVCVAMTVAKWLRIICRPRDGHAESGPRTSQQRQQDYGTPRGSWGFTHRDYDVAHVLLGHKHFLRPGEIAQRKRVRQHGPQGALLDEPHDALHGPRRYDRGA